MMPSLPFSQLPAPFPPPAAPSLRSSGGNCIFSFRTAYHLFKPSQILYGMPLVFAAILIALAVILWSFGWRWEHTVKRPPLNSFPLESILIPAYKSAATIRQTLSSVSALAYPHKEIIVANDTDDATPAICKEFGARCIQSSQRMGKARSLNAAVKHAR